MYPRTIQFKKSRAEVRMFAALNQGLGGDYVVLHNVRWLDKQPGNGAREGETDFIVAHPERACWSSR